MAILCHTSYRIFANLRIESQAGWGKLCPHQPWRR